MAVTPSARSASSRTRRWAASAGPRSCSARSVALQRFRVVRHRRGDPRGRWLQHFQRRLSRCQQLLDSEAAYREVIRSIYLLDQSAFYRACHEDHRHPRHARDRAARGAAAARERLPLGRFVRTIVEVETDEGLDRPRRDGRRRRERGRRVQRPQALSPRPRPRALEELRFLIANPTASLYNNRTQMLAALEFACLDILGQKWGVPVCDILGGRVARPRAVRVVPVLSLPERADGTGEVRTVDQLVAEAQELKAQYGFTIAQAEGRRVPARVRARVLSRARRGAARRHASASTRTACGPPSRRSGSASSIEDLNNDYLEDPVFGLHGMRRTREKVRMPLATNTVVVGFEQLAANVLDTARRRHPARHDVLGRHPAVREGGRRLRDVPARRRGALVGRARASSSRRCCTSAPCFRTSRSPPMRTTTISSTT